MIHREPSPLPSVLSLCIKHRQRAVPGSRDPTLACVGSTSWPPGLAPSSLSVRRQRKQGWARRVLNERLPQEQALLCWVVCHSCAVVGRLPAPPLCTPAAPCPVQASSSPASSQVSTHSLPSPLPLPIHLLYTPKLFEKEDLALHPLWQKWALVIIPDTAPFLCQTWPVDWDTHRAQELAPERPPARTGFWLGGHSSRCPLGSRR